MKNIYLLLSLFLFAFSNYVNAQQKYDKNFYLIDIKPDFVFDPIDKHDVDSILKLYHVTKNDTVKLYYLRLFSEGLTNEYLWTRYNRVLYQYTLNKKDSLNMFYNACAVNNLGYEAQYIKNDLEAAKKYYTQSYEMFKEINNSGGVGVEINNLAYLYQHEGNIAKAVELYTEAANYFEKHNLSLGLASIYINLGDIYFKNNDYIKAEDFFKKALIHALKTDQKLVIANVYYQLGLINVKKNNFLKGVDYYQKAANIYESDHNYNKLALIYSGLANAYINSDKTLFEKYTFKALHNAKLSSDLQVKSRVYELVSGYYVYKSDLKNALIFADSSYRFATQLSYPELISNASERLSDIHNKLGHYDLAYTFLREMKIIADSLNKEATQKSIIKSQYQIEYNKKSIELKAEQDKKDAIRNAEKKQQQIILLLTIIAAIIVSTFGFIAFKNFKKVQKANLIIENQKLEVELKNEEITHQKELVEEKQKEIIDSINYAKRIQHAVLTGEDTWQKIAKEHFMLFKPKDIVSGDFYWAYNTLDNRSIFALADCTGHGVPGGFMSMLGISFLNEIVIENKIFKADVILNKLRAKVISALEQKGGTQQKDGMDISLCVWNKQDNTLEFAGANNPLWLLKNAVSSSGSDGYLNENKEFQEIKADKMPIGTYLDEEKPFSSTTIQLQKGDIIFLRTDGYADQFGGPNGKKFKYKPLIEAIIKNSHLSMNEQKQALEKAFNDWQDEHEQVDDVTIIGVCVS